MAYAPGVDTVILNGVHELLLAVPPPGLAPETSIIWRHPILIQNVRAPGTGYPAEADVRDGVVYGDLEQFEGVMVAGGGGGEVSVVF